MQQGDAWQRLWGGLGVAVGSIVMLIGLVMLFTMGFQGLFYMAGGWIMLSGGLKKLRQ